MALPRWLRRIVGWANISYARAKPAVYVGEGKVLCGRSFNGRPAHYLVDARDRLISPGFILGKTYEHMATAWLCRHLDEDSHCLDLGANFGYFSVLMALLAPRGRVIGVEPDAAVADYAMDNVVMNGLKDRCAILQAAIHEREGEVTLFRRMQRSGNTSIAACGVDFTNSMREAPEQPFTVPALRVDDLLPRLGGRLDVMKVDVEGAEPLVFRGARQAIAGNPRLRIIMEWSPGQIRAAGFAPDAFVDEILGMGLSIGRLCRGGWVAAISRDQLLAAPYLANLLIQKKK
ncbi:FkbM family methyltransferase [Roseomonas sp. GC11]|uniref:FkbM family methyltransferase n=1 Tax=Roseomonas sp. GC11 TaxID=2950546 RepID=UPI00210DC2C9|nr:FkbM family methyltransferase [Roseomonas sp. GC11]MCQ4158955.1 FkbM family methyltransferase [Roseomonas sp. GC11]